MIDYVLTTMNGPTGYAVAAMVVVVVLLVVFMPIGESSLIDVFSKAGGGAVAILVGASVCSLVVATIALKMEAFFKL